MRSFKILALAAVAAVCLTATTPKTQAQIGISIGVAPECPYGYHDYAPYNCAPYGYYGPEWFNGGVFVGAGPWFHGPDNFRGHVDNHYDVQRGYKGAQPNRGDKVEAGREGRTPNEFKGNEARDGRGHVAGEKR
jgi:hypothetical protein